jgi:hypothetical protein
MSSGPLHKSEPLVVHTGHSVFKAPYGTGALFGATTGSQPPFGSAPARDCERSFVVWICNVQPRARGLPVVKVWLSD